MAIVGRELKRVPLDFNYPMNKVWQGFINPHYTATECPICAGCGLTHEAEHLQKQWYGYSYFHPSETGSSVLTPETPAVRAFAERNANHLPDYYGSGETAIIREAQRLCAMWNTQWCNHLDQDDVDALLAGGRLYDLTRHDHIPSVQEVNNWNILGMGHDAINQYICLEAKCERLGISMWCDHCDGSGEIWESEEAKRQYEEWEPVEPPVGDGYQVWETVSEGSPISPVFTTKDELANWLIIQGYSEGAAEQFAEEGFAFSMMVANDRIYKDIESLNAALDVDSK